MNSQVIIETSMGRLELELWPDRAPRHVANFEKLVDMKFYDNLVFHRVIPGFMIQTGCPNGTGTGGPGWKVDHEFNKTPFTRGVVGMARSAHPNSAGSQFFICVADAGHLNGSYSAFGKVMVGMEVCDKIASAPRDRRDNPLEEIRMISATMPGLKKKVKTSAPATPEASAAAAPIPVAVNPVAEKPVATKPLVEKPVATPAATAAVTKAVTSPVTKKPAATKAAAKKAVSKKPALKKSAAKKAVSKKPAAKKPAAKKTAGRKKATKGK